MRRALAVALAAMLLAGCVHKPPPLPNPDPSRTPSPVPSLPAYPRKDITPGALNPDVTQQTISSTICVKGWTETVRPPSSYTDPLKRQQITQYGYADTNLADYEEDHLVPLALGGAPRDPRNLWPQPIDQARVKDRDEAHLQGEVCSAAMTLADARAAILSAWGPRP